MEEMKNYRRTAPPPTCRIQGWEGPCENAKKEACEAGPARNEHAMQLYAKQDLTLVDCSVCVLSEPMCYRLKSFIIIPS